MRQAALVLLVAVARAAGCVSSAAAEPESAEVVVQAGSEVVVHEPSGRRIDLHPQTDHLLISRASAERCVEAVRRAPELEAGWRAEAAGRARDAALAAERADRKRVSWWWVPAAGIAAAAAGAWAGSR